MRMLVLVVLLFAAAPLGAEARPSPDESVTETLRALAQLVSECRLPLAGDPAALRGVVDQHLRPAADVLYAGQLILGRYWSEADPVQRRRFAEALYGTLASRYATALLLLTDRNVAVVPARETQGESQAEVELRIQAGLAAPMPVFLQMRRAGERWRVFDARWEGQSYVLSLRSAFSQQIHRDGLEAVIVRLESTAGLPVGLPEERQTAAGRCLRARAVR